MSGRMEGRRGGFTLIELMVVIMIVGVLFAVALPMFENAGKKDPQQAAQTLMNTMRLARQHAISARQWTLVVFPNQDSGYTAEVKAVNNLDRCLRSYAVLAVTNNMDGKMPKSSDMEFEFLTEWRSLPPGIYFDDSDKVDFDPTEKEDEKMNYLFHESSNKQGYHGAFTFPWDPEDPNNNGKRKPMSAILFKPNGRVFTMCDGAPNSFWQDREGLFVSVSSEVFYPNSSENDLGEPVEMPGGTRTIITLENKTGQMRLK